MRHILSLLCTALMAVPLIEAAFSVTTNTVDTSSSTTTANTSRLIPILVGGSSLTFTPNSVVAQPGDVLQFQFGARNHTVTQSAQQAPCLPLANNALHSGFITFDGGKSGTVTTFDVPVMNNQPMWLYCAQATHCQQGMVMAINPPSSSDLIAYASLAAAAMQNLPAASVAGGVAATIPLANALVPVPMAQASNATTPMTGPPAAAPSGTGAGAPGAPGVGGGGTATVFTTVIVGPSGAAAGNTSPGMPGQATGGGVAAAGVSVSGSLTFADTESTMPSTSGGHMQRDGAVLFNLVVSGAAAALGTLLFTARP